MGTCRNRERERIPREKLAKLDADDPAGFPLADNLAAALDRLGRSEEVVAVMRDKQNMDIFIPPNSMFAKSKEYWEKGQTSNKRADAENAEMTSFHIQNNTRVSFMVFAG